MKKYNLANKLMAVSITTLMLSITVAQTFAVSTAATSGFTVASGGALSIATSDAALDLATNITFDTAASNLTGGDTTTITLEDKRGTLVGWDSNFKFTQVMYGGKVVAKTGNGSSTLTIDNATAILMNKSGDDWTDSAHCTYTVVINTTPDPDQYAVTKGDNADAGEECDDDTTMQTTTAVGDDVPIGGNGLVVDIGGTPSANDTFYVTISGFEYSNFGWTLGTTTAVNNSSLHAKVDGADRTRGAANSGGTIIDTDEATAASDAMRILQFPEGTGGGKYTRTLQFEMVLPAGPRLLTYGNNLTLEIL